MNELTLLLDLVLAVATGLVGGLVAQRLGQPVILGYLAAGVAIGPFSPGPVGNVHNLSVLAEAGVALLMFGLGAESSLTELRRIGRVATVGGVLQIVGSMALGVAVGQLLGLSPYQALFFGALTALSSTVVAIKLLLGRGELGSLHGRVAVGILIIQDLCLVPMMVILPALAEPPDLLALELLRAIVTAAGLLIVTIVAGTRLIPWILDRVAATGSRELFLLCVVALALGTAMGTQFFGLSLAFGAFLAGLVVSESDLSHQAVAEVLPLRDLFATLFFVSVGMLVDPLFVADNLPAVLLVAGVVIVGKVILVTALVRAFGFAARVALLTALAIPQMGEFSFVLARQGVDRGLIDPYLYNLTLTGAVITIVASPALLQSADPLLRFLRKLPVLRGQFIESPVAAPDDDAVPALSRHTVICGFGRVGRELADALERRGFAYLVIEYDPRVANQVRARGIPVIFGDAGNPEVLRHANLDRARVLAVSIPDLTAANRAVREARAMNARLDIIARAPGSRGLERLRAAGAVEIVRPELEAGLEFVRHTLHRYGVSRPEIQAIVSSRRAQYYGSMGDGEDRGPDHGRGRRGSYEE
jgi:CPA2 family monovalent cation:H+ antiporter-2